MDDIKDGRTYDKLKEKALDTEEWKNMSWETLLPKKKRLPYRILFCLFLFTRAIKEMENWRFIWKHRKKQIRVVFYFLVFRFNSCFFLIPEQIVRIAPVCFYFLSLLASVSINFINYQ